MGHGNLTMEIESWTFKGEPAWVPLKVVWYSCS
jgi:hypothetical protein